MNRNQLVDRCKALIAEAYQEATEMIVAYLETHPDEKRQSLCKEIDSENWRALEARVMRLQEKRRSEGISGVTISRDHSVEKAALGLKDPERLEKALERLSDDELTRAARRVNQAAAKRHTGEARPRTKPEVDYDGRFQDAVAEVVYRLADRAAGRWTPNERSEAALHFLRRALDDPTAIDTDQLVEDISAYLEEVAT